MLSYAKYYQKDKELASETEQETNNKKTIIDTGNKFEKVDAEKPNTSGQEW